MAARIDDPMVLNAAVSKTGLAKYLRDREQVIPNDFGGLGDGVADDRAALQACFQRAAVDQKFAVVPPGTWNVSGGVVLPGGARGLLMRGVVRYTGTAPETALALGDGGTVRNGEKLYAGLQVVRQIQSDWSSEADIGVLVRSIDASVVDLRLVSGFTIGLRSLGDGRGVEDSTFHLGRILNCKVGPDVRCATATAWNTSVRYYGGHFACATGVNPTLDRFGIRFGQEPGAYSNHNRHVFDGPNFELRQLDPNVAIPFLNETSGSAVIGRALRMEACSPFVARHTAGAQDCEYEVAWANTYRVGIQYTATAIRCGNAVYNRHRAPMSRLVRALGAVPNLRAAAFRHSATEVGCEGLAAVATSTTAATTLAGLSFNLLDGIAATSRGLLLDTQKGFAFAHWLVNGADGGRLFARCFGGDANVRKNIAGDVLASLTTMQWNAPSKAWTGGAVMADSSLNRRMTVRLGDAVAFAQVGIVWLDGQIELEALRLYGLPAATAAWRSSGLQGPSRRPGSCGEAAAAHGPLDPKHGAEAARPCSGTLGGVIAALTCTAAIEGLPGSAAGVHSSAWRRSAMGRKDRRPPGPDLAPVHAAAARGGLFVTPSAPGTQAPVASLRLLLPHLRPYAARAAGAMLALLLAAGLVLALGQGLRRLVDEGFADGAPGRLDRAALLMFAVVAALAAATSARFYLVSWLGERVAADLRRDVFSHVLGLSPAFFDAARTGDILSRLTADVSLLQALIGSSVSMGLRNAVTGLGAFAMLVATSPKLAGLALVVVPLVVGPLVVFGRRERRLSRAAQERVADLAATAEETLNGLRTVQAFTHEPLDRARFAAEVERSVDAALRRVASRTALILVVILLGFGAVTLSLWVGGRDVAAGRMTGGELSAFVFYAVLVASSGAAMSELWGEIQRAAAAADRLGELLATRPAIAAPAAPRRLPGPPLGRVAFEDVVFAYPNRPGTGALDRFTLEVAPGETVALVGPSGAGKTTVLQLLLRFYDPQAGRVRVDGVDVGTVDPAALRARLGLVPQDPVVFGASAAENIRYGRPEATDAELRAAAEAAGAAAFIEALPRGYGTPLGPRGVTLSGGQRQRIAIARAVLRDPPILLLDEATSALDAETEQAVQRALERLARGRTTLVVAHRLATVRRADRIVVMDGGRVVATGTHAALVREGGLYARLAALQFSDGA